MENLTLSEEEKKAQSPNNERSFIDLTCLDKEIQLANLLTFANNHCGQSAESDHESLASLQFENFSQFASFKSAVTGLLGTHPRFSSNIEAVQATVSSQN